MEEMRHAYMTFMTKHQERRPLQTPMHRCEDGIKLDLTEMWCEMDSSGSG
jgi:hypothetical protein